MIYILLVLSVLGRRYVVYIITIIKLVDNIYLLNLKLYLHYCINIIYVINLYLF